MNLADYTPIIVQIILAVGIALSIIVVSHIFGQKGGSNVIQNSPYECGVLTLNNSSPHFAVKFYLVAMLFILFDIEAVFLVPLSLIYREFINAQIPILLPALFFVGVLVVGLIYELKNGALEWSQTATKD